MPTHNAVVKASVGLHARAAAVFVRAATQTGLPVTISKEGSSSVDARSLLQVMAADFHQGCMVELGISDAALSGPLGRQEAEDALRALGELLESQGAA
ncbi:HPr family phosphocarrier protein [Arthrobacter sp. PGP41]|uniref:HPr family phosphocarrier protein n=1 Tax=unclassified Arthrobacter TaxID=235627 RepID=UPI000CDBDFFE|nr:MULTISPECIES: HPr family phosphocarrier protein [unclassified Arthrobacter]AUZ34817.1 HPr family phosphocarrier protein [Arthrobacter sp. PGP41]MDT0195900.1 HPr family phosphocarrier protein [Arthrobacter sp. AB6]